MNSRIILLVVLAAALASAYITAAVYAEDPDSDDFQGEQTISNYLAFIEIGGVRTQIGAGDRIEAGDTMASGTQSSGEGCQLSETHIIGRLTPTLNIGSISAIIGSDCSITITDISLSSVASSGTSSNSNGQEDQRHRGWAKSEFNDAVWIDLAATYASMYYYDDSYWMVCSLV